MGQCLISQGARLGSFSLSVMFRELPESTGSECLGSMTPETQDFYLRMDHHRRRSGYRLGRIIARQQLLKKIAGGRTEPFGQIDRPLGLLVYRLELSLPFSTWLQRKGQSLNESLFVISLGMLAVTEKPACKH